MLFQVSGGKGTADATPMGVVALSMRVMLQIAAEKTPEAQDLVTQAVRATPRGPQLSNQCFFNA